MYKQLKAYQKVFSSIQSAVLSVLGAIKKVQYAVSSGITQRKPLTAHLPKPKAQSSQPTAHCPLPKTYSLQPTAYRNCYRPALPRTGQPNFNTTLQYQA